MLTRIEYAAHYPFDASAEPQWVYHGPTTREDAELFVRFVNARMKQAGSQYRASLMEREVTVGPWRLANTGVVAPTTTERITRGRREGPRQGEDDRGGGAGDVGQRPDDRRATGG